MKNKDKILYKSKKTKITMHRNNLKEALKGLLGLIVFILLIVCITIYLKK